MQAEQQSERELFEAWARSIGKTDRDLQREDWNGSGEYSWITEKSMWEAWQARAALSHPSTPQGWVSVNERLPKPWEDVLIYPRPTDYCCEGHVDHKGQWFYGEYVQHVGHENHRINPTHWSPMPPPPEQGSKG